MAGRRCTGHILAEQVLGRGDIALPERRCSVKAPIGRAELRALSGGEPGRVKCSAFGTTLSDRGTGLLGRQANDGQTWTFSGLGFAEMPPSPVHAELIQQCLDLKHGASYDAEVMLSGHRASSGLSRQLG